MSGVFGVVRSVAVAAGAACALMDSVAVAAAAPHPVRAEATDGRGGGEGGDGTLITRLRTPSTGTSIASPGRDTLYACKGGTLTRPDRPWIDAHGVIDVLKRPFVSGTMRRHKALRVWTTAAKRHFRGNGLPGHATGRFRGSSSTTTTSTGSTRTRSDASGGRR